MTATKFISAGLIDYSVLPHCSVSSMTLKQQWTITASIIHKRASSSSSSSSSSSRRLTSLPTIAEKRSAICSQTQLDAQASGLLCTPKLPDPVLQQSEGKVPLLALPQHSLDRSPLHHFDRKVGPPRGLPNHHASRT